MNELLFAAFCAFLLGMIVHALLAAPPEPRRDVDPSLQVPPHLHEENIMPDEPRTPSHDQLTWDVTRQLHSQERAHLGVAIGDIETLIDTCRAVNRSSHYCQALAALNLALAELVETQQTANALLAAHLQDIITAPPKDQRG